MRETDGAYLNVPDAPRPVISRPWNLLSGTERRNMIIIVITILTVSCITVTISVRKKRR